MLTSALWGLVQGLTEFLPISSSGHLVLVPALLDVEGPDLATSAVLHLGTLAALLWYFRREVWGLVAAPRSRESRTIWMLLVVGTIPAAVVGLTLEKPIDIIFNEPWIVAVALITTGIVLAFASLLPSGPRRVEEGNWRDALIVGIAQAFALLPGISRSGMTMTGALAMNFSRRESARFAFLLGIPAIAGAGLRETIELVDRGGFEASLMVGTAVAAVSGYLAVSLLIRLIERTGLIPYAAYCIAFGAFAYLTV